MSTSTDPLRALATLALLHEVFDDAWRAAVARGRATGEAVADPDASTATGADVAFLDALAGLVADEKDRLKEEWAQGRAPEGAERSASVVDAEEVAARLEELRFELAEVRGRLESLESMLGGLLARIDDLSAAAGRRTEGTGRR